jgi:hypothetical protein
VDQLSHYVPRGRWQARPYGQSDRPILSSPTSSGIALAMHKVLNPGVSRIASAGRASCVWRQTDRLRSAASASSRASGGNAVQGRGRRLVLEWRGPGRGKKRASSPPISGGAHRSAVMPRVRKSVSAETDAVGTVRHTARRPPARRVRSPRDAAAERRREPRRSRSWLRQKGPCEAPCARTQKSSGCAGRRPGAPVGT